MEEAQRLGPFELRWPGSGPRGDADGETLVLALDSAGEPALSWREAGGTLGVHALIPVAGLEAAKRRRHALIAAGGGAAVPALAGAALGLEQVTVVLQAPDRAAFESAVAAIAHPHLSVLDHLTDAPADPRYHLAMWGCRGAVPDLADCRGLVQRLKPEGQLVLFGLPKESLDDMFEELARRSWSLRAAGIQDGLAFLAGAVETPGRFAG